MQVGNIQANLTTLCPSPALPEPALEAAGGRSSPWLAQVDSVSAFSLLLFTPSLGLFPPLQQHFEHLSLTQSLHFHRKIALSHEHAEVGTAAVGIWERLNATQKQSCRTRENSKNATTFAVLNVCLGSKLTAAFPYPCSSPEQFCAQSLTATPILT